MNLPLPPEHPDTAANAEQRPIAAENAAPSITSATPAVSASWEQLTLEKLVFATLAEQKTARRWK